MEYRTVDISGAHADAHSQIFHFYRQIFQKAAVSGAVLPLPGCTTGCDTSAKLLPKICTCSWQTTTVLLDHFASGPCSIGVGMQHCYADGPGLIPNPSKSWWRVHLATTSPHPGVGCRVTPERITMRWSLTWEDTRAKVGWVLRCVPGWEVWVVHRYCYG